MKIILFPMKIINWLLNYTIFSIINFFYPIFDLLFNKYIQYSTDPIKEEEKNIINQTINDLTSKLNIDNLYKDDFNKLITSLSKYEKIYVKDMDTYRNFMVTKLTAIKHIGSTHSTFAIEQVKNTTAINL